jgi:hypothetical protein
MWSKSGIMVGSVQCLPCADEDEEVVNFKVQEWHDQAPNIYMKGERAKLRSVSSDFLLANKEPVAEREIVIFA